RNPRAATLAGTTRQRSEGRLVAGGSLVTDAAYVGAGATLFDLPEYGVTRFIEPLNGAPIGVRRSGDPLLASPGAVINLAGASDSHDQEVALGQFALVPVWSAGGALTLGAGGSLAGARISAGGGVPIGTATGAALAPGGTLTWRDPVLQQRDGTVVTRDAVAADQIMAAGFDTFVAQGALTTLGDVNLTLARAFYLVAPDYAGDSARINQLSATVGATGALAIAAPYVRFASPLQTATLAKAEPGTAPGTATAKFSATTVDVVGSVHFDPSLARVDFNVSGDFRLTGVQSPQLTIIGGSSTSAVTSALSGQLVVSGDLGIRAAQIYPTTGTGSLQQDINVARNGTGTAGTPYLIASTGAKAVINFARSSTATPETPWSAGGSLLVQAAQIDQSGVVRVPLGRLQLGSNTALALGPDASQLVPATQGVVIGSGSITSVSAGGLNIPYGTTTDLIEYFFAPTSDARLFAPPAAELRLVADSVDVASGASVDLSGGGDVYAYEFVAGVGGSRDVLSRTNSDVFSGNDGLQYADGRQVYAIVPSLAGAAVAPFDPIYSADYAGLYAAADAGRRVYLEAAPGLVAGWYTLLPARYALLPGGMRVVENTGVEAAAPGTSATLRDGSIIVAGRYGVSGTNIEESQRRTFTVMSQAVLRKYSRLETTSATETFKKLAERDKLAVPQLPADAARLVLAPLSDLSIAARFQTATGSGGRGAQVDIAGNAFEIVVPGTAASGNGVITLTTTDFTNLNAASLLIGGTRLDKADGTTLLTATAKSILVANDAANPLAGPEVVLVVDGLGSAITLADGATIIGSGTLLDTRTGNYVISASATTTQTAIGGIVRVANGPERLIDRPGELALANSLSQTDISIGAATLTGTSILLDSTRDLAVTDQAAAAGTLQIRATNLALGGDDVFFTTTPSGFRGLTITPTLEAQFALAERLTITSKSIIGFGGGVHAFNDLVLDARGLRPYGQATGAPLPPPGQPVQTDTLVADPAAAIAVTLQLRSLTLLNSDRDRGICGGTYVAACGSTGNTLTIDAAEVHFGSGAMRTYGFDAAVTINAGSGIFAEGSGSLDVGGARLALDTPYLGERALVADPRGQKLQPGLSLLTSNDFVLTNRLNTLAAAVAAAPGARLSIGSAAAPVRSASIDNALVRATAGQVDIRADGNILVSGSASIAAPGYAKTFGDNADAVAISAPGGGITLVSATGDVDFAASTQLSIGGGSGNAGTLQLVAASGLVRLPGKIDANAPGGAASLTLDSGRNPLLADTSGTRLFDLPTFIAGAGARFNGRIDIRVGEGDLTLAAGQILRATEVRLTTDAGSVAIAGSIDTSGTSGGNIGLYGATGVTLAATARLDANAAGYGATDTRNAQGGTVEIGTAPGGSIAVAAGAVIDVAALRTGARLIETVRKDALTLNDTISYDYASGDTGGSVLLRAPLVGADAVGINFAGSIEGARLVAVEAYRIFDLKALAGAADCSLAADICINGAGQVVLDLNAVPTGGINRLADDAPGSVVNFVRNFSLAGAGGLGTLAAAGVVARPGIELAYDGDIVLASNWNLGAGVVDVARATAAGLMQVATALGNDAQGRPLSAIVPGAEAEIFADYTNFLYRVGGRADKAAGVLTLRAGGNLRIEHSITDGFFTFADQTDPNYLSFQLGGGDRQYRPALNVVCGTFNPAAFACSSLSTPFLAFPGNSAVPYAAADIITISATALALGQDLQFADGAAPVIAPYNAAANAAGATGAGPGGSGDPIGSAVLFPLLADDKVADSFSLRLVGGAAGGSADPLRVAPVSTASVTIDGEASYRAAPAKGVASYAGALQLFNYGFPGNIDLTTATITAPTDFIAAIEGLDGSFYTRLNFGTNAAIASYFRSTSQQYLAAQAVPAGDFQFFGGTPAAPTILAARLDVITEYLQSISVDFGTKVAAGFFNYAKPTARAATNLANANVFTRTLVRTGTGSIDIAAAQDVDLGATGAARFRNVEARSVSAGSGAGAQVGGTAVYTAGHRVVPTASLATVTASGAELAVDAGALAVAALAPRAALPNYQGVLASDPVYASGGGAIAVSAGRDVLGRRDVWSESFRTGAGPGGAVGSAAQNWRVGNVGAADLAVTASVVTNIRVNPQLFSTGFGALGGGSIAVSAGRDVRDVTLAADTSVTTAKVGADGALALVSYGGGDISVNSGRDVLGGRISLSAGTATVVAAGDIASAGTLRLAGTVSSPTGAALEENRLLVRLGNGTAALSAGGSIAVAA
ncbi:MAG: beta strand repeat-containing protein, partial [Polymorphobacter sp.]